ncbi:hypothetical protein PCANC_22431 [Puccinia coronata f. sp. avenae]|uniref:Uncharacterized protein n=1 Tax=Puccinia coronata f. sp. avenae TaxID=200324 RepID=A0A2N5TL57_9BASI|nr:hypothetical protein PCANC_22431 [Puccinia coronata f. sp. avenae]PLW50456.1 hypothetical protein PCASD_01402 [Puccinia coronata f. sp. avenae]
MINSPGLPPAVELLSITAGTRTSHTRFKPAAKLKQGNDKNIAKMVQRDSGKGKPNYLTSQAREDEQSVWKQILAQEMNDPECRKANKGILIGFGVFISSIAFFKLAGDLLVPAF